MPLPYSCTAAIASLFDDLVGAGKQRGWHVRLSAFAAARFLVPGDSIDVCGREPVQAPTSYEVVIWGETCPGCRRDDDVVMARLAMPLYLLSCNPSILSARFQFQI